MKVSLTPNEMSRTLKREMKQWLEAQLTHPELAGGTSLPMTSPSGYIGLYLNGEPRLVTAGRWQATDFQSTSVSGNLTIRVGGTPARPDQAPPLADRLAVLGGLIGVFNLWDELKAQYSAAVGRIILEAYNSCFHNMVQAPQPAVKLAFSSDRQNVAVQYQGDEAWYANNGQPVEVDDTWQQVAA